MLKLPYLFQKITMKKPTIYILTTLLLIGLPIFTHAQDTKPLSGEHITKNLTQTIFDSLIITFPKGWETRITTIRTEELDNGKTAQTTNFGFAGKGELLTIIKIPTADWNEINNSGNKYKLFSEKDGNIFAYTASIDSSIEETSKIQWIINNIIVQKQPLKDVSETTNGTAINFLTAKNIVKGYEDGTFKPANEINRAELMKIIVTSKGQKPVIDAYSDCFTDVKLEWFAPYICYAKEQNWVKGYDDSTFKPGQLVNKAEAIKMIVSAHGFELPETVTQAPFNDIDPTAWFAPFVETAKTNGLLTQTEENYGIAENITRGEVAENIYRALLVNLVPEAETFTPTEDSNFPEIDTESTGLTPTLADHAIFLSEPFKFSIEYPKNYFYGTVETEDESIIRRYEFGSNPIDEEIGQYSLELRNTSAPDGTILTLNGKELTLSYTETEVNIYYTDAKNRLYRLNGPIELDEELQNLATTIEIYDTIPSSSAPQAHQTSEEAFSTEPTI